MKTIAMIMMIVSAMCGLSTPAQAQALELLWSSVDCGGGQADGGGFALDCTIGQSDVGQTLTGGGFSLAGGFWPGTSPVCSGDLNGSNTVNVEDLLAVIGAWGSCANPSNCPADIAPAGGNDIVNVQDLLAVIAAWGPCP